MEQSNMEQAVGSVQAWLALYGLKVLGGILIFFVGRIVAKILRSVLLAALRKANTEESIVSFVGHLSYSAMMTFVVLAALSQVGFRTTSMVAVIGAAGLAVGLALQGSLSNFAAGVLLIIFKPFRVGDFVEASGVLGKVEELQIFTTHLVTPDNKTVIVPNSLMTGGNITNYSVKGTRRVDLVIGVSYGDNIKKVKDVLTDILATNDLVLEEPAPTVNLCELGDSSVNFAVRPWVKVEDYWAVFFGVQEAAKLRFDEEGISIPFPQSDVHLFQQNAG